MSQHVEVYKCPHCGGALSYDPEWRQYACASCGSLFDIELFRPKIARQLHGFKCPECGAKLVGDKAVASFSCPYCGNNEIIPDRFKGKFSPDAIIPFELDEEDALERWREDQKLRYSLPDDFAKQAKFISKEGVYVPFWLFSGSVHFDITYKVLVAGGESTPDKHYLHLKKGTFDFRRIPADASVRMPDDLMDSIQSYKLDQLKPFTTDYMPGFVAERYSEAIAESWKRVERQVREGTLDFVRPKYGKATPAHREIDITDSREFGTIEHILLPVWMFTIAYAGKRYVAAVNGQTGRVAMNYPIDEQKLKDIAFRQGRNQALIYGGLASMGAIVMIAISLIAMRSLLESIISIVLILAACGVFMGWIGMRAYNETLRVGREQMVRVRPIRSAAPFFVKESRVYTSDFRRRRSSDDPDVRLEEYDKGIGAEIAEAAAPLLDKILIQWDD